MKTMAKENINQNKEQWYNVLKVYLEKIFQQNDLDMRDEISYYTQWESTNHTSLYHPTVSWVYITSCLQD